MMKEGAEAQMAAGKEEVEASNRIVEAIKAHVSTVLLFNLDVLYIVEAIKTHVNSLIFGVTLCQTVLRRPSRCSQHSYKTLESLDVTRMAFSL